MTKIALAVLTICLFGWSCNSTQFTTSKQLDSICIPVIDDFFKKVENDIYEKAIKDLLASNENISLTDSSTIELLSRFKFANQNSGRFNGKSLIKERSINNDLVIYSYLAKYEKKCYRFLFLFYNNGSSTKLCKFSFDDSLDVELEGSLKLYM